MFRDCNAPQKDQQQGQGQRNTQVNYIEYDDEYDQPEDYFEDEECYSEEKYQEVYQASTQ